MDEAVTEMRNVQKTSYTPTRTEVKYQETRVTGGADVQNRFSNEMKTKSGIKAQTSIHREEVVSTYE